MSKMSKRFQEISKKIEPGKTYDHKRAVEALKDCPPVKFDQSVDISIKMGIDPKQSDQQVRGTMTLPHGTGKNIRILVIAKAEKAEEAKKEGADFVGAEDLIEKIQGGWLDFDALVVTPDLMREVGKLGKILGPRGLMPSPKAGTVTQDVSKAVKELKTGKIEFKTDRHGMINQSIGKLSFESDQLVKNAEALIQAIYRAKPPGAKGQYMQSAFLSSTMGPGLKLETRQTEL